MSGLVTFFSSPLKDAQGDALLAKLRGEKNDEIVLFPLVQKCLDFEIETLNDVYSYYETVITLLFLRKLSGAREAKIEAHLPSLLKKGECHGGWKTVALQEGYHALASYLYDGRSVSPEMKQLEKGGVLQDGGHHHLFLQLPHPYQASMLALVSFYIGWELKDEEWMHRGVKLTEFCLSLCDQHGDLFQGLWIPEEEFSRDAVSRFSLLYLVASKVCLSSKVQVLSEAVDGGQADLFLALFALGFQKLIEEDKPFPKVHEGIKLYDLDRSLGFLRYEEGDLSLACSYSGANTGLGAFHKKGVHITSFGPHFAPLSDSSCYGIFRSSNGSQEGFRDLSLEIGEGKALCQGWVPIGSPESPLLIPGRQWLYFSLEGEGENVEMTTRLSQYDEENPLYFAFFISADKALLESGSLFQPKTLDKYQGETQKICLIKGEAQVTLTPQFKGEMEVIPLAGEDHFWSADFLIAFPMREKMKALTWEIK